MVKKKAKKVSSSSRNNGLFARNKHLRWLLPLYAFSLLLLFLVNSVNQKGNILGTATDNCKTGINSFQVLSACATDKYKYAAYSCYDESTGKLGGETSCKKADEWEVHVKRLCDGKSSCSLTPTPTKVFPTKSLTPKPTQQICKTGLNGISFKEACGENKYRYMNYSCYDGTKGTQGAPTSCKPTNSWIEYAKRVCEGKSSCKLTPKPTKSITKTPTVIITKIPTPTPTIIP